MYNKNAQDYKVALPLIKGLVWWGDVRTSGKSLALLLQRTYHAFRRLSYSRDVV